ncbi:hypothetical protein FACS189499_08690 [Clostridia bacterium]|nr:hypothetical protein FACS189499_08690 [Clostridia bacterium]
MSLLSELNTLLSPLAPVETGIFSGSELSVHWTVRTPDEYFILTPLSNDFDVFADNRPNVDIQNVRVSLYSKKNYNQLLSLITIRLMDAEIIITERRYIGYESDTNYHHYMVDVSKYFTINGGNENG